MLEGKIWNNIFRKILIKLALYLLANRRLTCHEDWCFKSLSWMPAFMWQAIYHVALDCLTDQTVFFSPQNHRPVLRACKGDEKIACSVR